MVVVLVAAGAALVVPSVAACELAEVTGCTPGTIPEPPAAPAPPPEPEMPVEPPAVLPPDTEAAEARLLVMINDDRRSYGLAPVSARHDVEEIADGHSAAMAAAHDIWHNDAYFSAATKRRLGASRVGENVALNRTADDAHRKLMASPQHRANILDPGYSVVGIAVAADENGRIYVTEDFLEPARLTPPAPPQVNPAQPSPPPGTPAPSGPPQPAPEQPAEAVVVEAEAPAPSGDAIELAIGPGASLPAQDGSDRPWALYFLAATLLGAAAVGLRKAAC